VKGTALNDDHRALKLAALALLAFALASGAFLQLMTGVARQRRF
jgi:hypothetical protein